MAFYFSDSTPAATTGYDNVLFQHDSTPNVSAQYKRDVKVSAVSTTGNIAVVAIETTERATAGASDITRTLPAASGVTERIVTVKKVDSGAGAVIVQGNGSPAESIDGGTTWTLSNQYQYVRLQSNGTGWDVIGNN